jgi:hypothetical protein
LIAPVKKFGVFFCCDIKIKSNDKGRNNTHEQVVYQFAHDWKKVELAVKLVNAPFVAVKKSRNKGLTLHPLSVNQIASAMLATPPIKKKKRKG